MPLSAEPTRLQDTALVAYLRLRGYLLKPDIVNERVDFVTFDDVESAMKEFYGGDVVNITAFCRHLKDVKTEMYNLKQIKK
jgi:hypothetical protein